MFRALTTECDRPRRWLCRPVCLGWLAVCAGLLVASPAPGQVAACSITAVDGQGARALRADAGATPIAPGPLPGGTTAIATGDARVEMLCNGDITITVGAQTTLDLRDLETGGSNTVFRLIRGIVGLVRHGAPDRTLEVETDLAIASARSTEWHVSAGPGVTAAFVREGGILVTGKAAGRARVVLGPGEGVDVTSAGPGPVRNWPQERIGAAGRVLGHGWD